MSKEMIERWWEYELGRFVLEMGKTLDAIIEISNYNKAS